jgi:hypothetical protein
MSGNITAITPLKRCSVMCAVELAARRPQPAMGEFKVLALSILDIASIDRISRHQAMILARLQTPTSYRALPRKSFRAQR